MQNALHIGTIPDHIVQHAVRIAIEEDFGRAGDITSAATIPADKTETFAFVPRDAGVISGLPIVTEVFRQLDPKIDLALLCNDGDHVQARSVIGTVTGPTRLILSGERVALNYLSHLSGIATLTRSLVDAVSGTKAKICSTRKTTPGLRSLEKYAVRCGGGTNHRLGLDDAILIKDNHVFSAGGIQQALKAAKSSIGHMVKVEIEVDTLEQLAEAIAEGADVIMLDNMSPDQLREAVKINNGRVILEASGKVTKDKVRQIAESGVDFISSGAITHSAPILDIGLDAHS